MVILHMFSAFLAQRQQLDFGPRKKGGPESPPVGGRTQKTAVAEIMKTSPPKVRREEKSLSHFVEKASGVRPISVR
jgi:hypothetical protein